MTLKYEIIVTVNFVGVFVGAPTKIAKGSTLGIINNVKVDTQIN